ncbi:MAG: Dipeptidyl-peptidase 5 [Verrucomicrobia subdivision 3 bacterium]|nr:Dipeptidyl-peptidase 5 [Limisphaerales bacterium]MCS1413841.1 Dipeptidyl-peptidase 5 [Limisphaerales bacterium]
MANRIVRICCAFWGGLLLAKSGWAQTEIDLERMQSSTAPVPIELEGFSGESRDVLAFDLEVMGWEVVPEGAGQFALIGGNNGGLQGKLVDRLGGSTLFSRRYATGTLRQQAHALANAVVEKVFRQKGIAHTKIAYKSRASGGFPEIYVADYDGYRAQAVTRDRSNVAAPAWVPGRLKLFYTSYKMGNPDIFTHDLLSGRRAAVSRYAGLNTSAALSADGSRMAMILSKGGSPDLYVADSSGRNLKQLTMTREEEACPCWSPDGSQICFTSAVGGGARLYLISPEGNGMRRLRAVGVSGVFSEPDWSPDGQWIAFTALMGRQFHICVVSAAGGEASVLSRGEDPSWAPNSRNIVFMRKKNGRKILSILDVSTKWVKDVPKITGNSSQPAWAR